MKLSRATSYAVHALAFMATDRGGRLMPAHVIAPDRGIPLLFLRKQLGQLESAGVLRSQRGPTGGYRLARPAATITLLEIIEAVDGPVRGEAPPLGNDSALERKLQAVCEKTAALARAELKKVTLADLAGMRQRKRASY
jgi:Rrf2 family protein